MTETPSDQHPEPVIVASYEQRGEAEVAKAHLAASDIEAFIVDAVEGGTLPVEGEGGVTVVVRAQDAEVAVALLAPEDPQLPV